MLSPLLCTPCPTLQTYPHHESPALQVMQQRPRRPSWNSRRPRYGTCKAACGRWNWSARGSRPSSTPSADFAQAAEPALTRSVRPLTLTNMRAAHHASVFAGDHTGSFPPIVRGCDAQYANVRCCDTGDSRNGGSNGGSAGGDGDRALAARVEELEQRLAQSEAERHRREAQHERDAQVSS